MTCAKQQVVCLLLDGNNNVISIGENWCLNPQLTCPRLGLETGMGYNLCNEICEQVSHAEIDAVNNLGEQKATTCILVGHYYCCKNCLENLYKIGINNFIHLPNPIFK